MLFVSLSHITLSNLQAASAFRRSQLPETEAATLLSQSRITEGVLGVASDDLAAPYSVRKYADHVDLCRILHERGVDLKINDFFARRASNPLQFAPECEVRIAYWL